MYNAELDQKYKGKYLYKIINRKSKEPLYIGSSENIYRRYQAHFHTERGTPFSKWCHWNGICKSNFRMIVLDLSEYDMIDLDELRVLEHELIYTNRHSVVNQLMTDSLTLSEVELLEFIYDLVEVNSLKWQFYDEIINNKKNTYQDWNLDKHPKKNFVR